MVITLKKPPAAEEIGATRKLYKRYGVNSFFLSTDHSAIVKLIRPFKVSNFDAVLNSGNSYSVAPVIFSFSYLHIETFELTFQQQNDNPLRWFMDQSLLSSAAVTRKYSLLAVSISVALIASSQAYAACDILTPSSNQTVTCDGAESTAVISTAGSTSVDVMVNSGGQLTVASGPAISLGDNSTVNNAGEITGQSTGILFREGSSQLSNTGAITGVSGPGVLFEGSGNNQLTSSGIITGGTGGYAVIFGSGNDTLSVTGGTITGNINQGAGADTANISAGTITGTLAQGNGIDDFVMSGGSLSALQQGDNRDTFLMEGGTIVGAFEDGDVADMTGGTIGRVDMKLDNNIFNMSGGEIINNLVTGFGNDTITISNNSIIGGNISVSGGTDSVTVKGGTINGEIRMSNGNDLFQWEKGTIRNSVLMGADNDAIEFTNLDLTSAATSPLIDGGAGTDILTMNNSQYVHRDATILQGIERINLSLSSTLTLDNRALALGDAADDNIHTGFVIDQSSTLAIRNDNAVLFNSHVSGTGTISTDTAGNAFDFTTNNAADNFAGTLLLGYSTFGLSGLNAQALSQATLKAGAGSITTVASGVQHIGSLVFDGGTVDFGRIAPGDTLASNTIQTRNNLDLSGTGTVQVAIDDMVNVHPVPATLIPLLAQDDATTTLKLAGSDGTVTGNGGSLILTDGDGNVITDSVTKNILQGGQSVAQGTWDWRLTSGENQDGLYVAWALKQIDLQGTGTSALLLNADGATGNAADLSAHVTGSGDLAFGTTQNGTVSLSNKENDYTGVTDVRSGYVQMNNDHVLGNTSLLQLAGGTGLDMNEHTQTVGAVDAAAGSQIDIAGGSLALNQGGTINGHLLGAGNLTQKAGTLTINGANSSLSAMTQILDGATINLNNAAGLGNGSIDNAGVLNLNNAVGMLMNDLHNSGIVNITASQIVLDGNNSRFSGTFNIAANSQLTAGEAKHVGTAAIKNSGTLKLATDNDWMLTNSVSGEGSLVKDGEGTVTLTQDSGAYTGKTEINQGGIRFGSRSQPVTLASSDINIHNGYLAGNGTVAGNVNNQGLLRVGSLSSTDISAFAVLLAESSTTDMLTIGGNLINAGHIQIGQVGSTLHAGNTLNVNGNYTGNGGTVAFNTVLGDDNSMTDRMFIQGDTSGTTYVSVQNVGGEGANTLNGIELINVAGNSAGTFLQSGRIVAGAYDYRLARGAGGNDRNWYLTNSTEAPLGIVDPTFPVEEPSPESIMLRPEAGSYVTNLVAANTMFINRLHDRLGETQYTDALTGEKRVTSLWLRQVGTHNGWHSDVGSLKTTSNQYVVMLGGDVAQWSSSGLDRLHLGIMAGYGNNQSRTHSGVTGYSSRGQTNGYSVGLYGTWYANDTDKTGLYLDSWAQYSWFKNTVRGEDIAEEKYNSKGLSASLESGYTWKIGEFYGSKNSLNTVYIQPKAQVTWMGVKADDHTDSNGTHVTSDGDGNIQTRLGTRFFLKGHSQLDEGKEREFEPFVEANWLHNTRSFSTSLNGLRISQDGARNIGELKTGIEGQISRNLTTWGNVGQQIGDNGYNNTEAVLGVKYSW
ncbi:autotransporter outer membrane beta-barrel domain-containing protein [Enterobacter ludwigii]|uniref:autotransporter outer membrane beta-barrel domain-containing protein n=1 Tax=Enterobacter ludwigii TaxID=299767 RepID=UPI003EDA645D